MQVARRGAKYGMLAPRLIQFEEEIEAELAGETPPETPPPTVQAQRITCDLMSLDEMVSRRQPQQQQQQQQPQQQRTQAPQKWTQTAKLELERVR